MGEELKIGNQTVKDLTDYWCGGVMTQGYVASLSDEDYKEIVGKWFSGFSKEIEASQ